MSGVVERMLGGAARIAGRVIPDASGRFVWGNGVVSMVFEASVDAPVRLVGLSGRGMRTADVNIPGEPDAQPIVELRSSIDGGGDNRLQLAASAAGLKLRFVEAFLIAPPMDESMGSGPNAKPMDGLAIVQRDPEGDGPDVISVFKTRTGLSAVRTYTILHSDEEYPVEAVSSMNVTLPLAAARLDDAQTFVYSGENSWDLENAWRCDPLRATPLRDRDQRVNPGMSSARFARSSSSTWSTGEYQPAGIIEGFSEDTSTRPFSFMWQIEHNGAWAWEIGEDDPGIRVSAYGPEYRDHQWFTMLGDGNDFVSVPVSFVICAGDWQRAVAEMTVHRRALRRHHAAIQGRSDVFDETLLTVVYNDYMNTLWGDPTIDKELPLVEGASKVGADVFCIDAGWYDDGDGGWWDMVGEWEPSADRFGTMRLAGLIHDIQAHGMTAGLWLEPEVIGVRSPLAKSLPDSAFFCRHGRRIADQGRYHLDFRSAAAREHATATVDRLIEEFGVGYFKFDYNTMPGVGTDVGADSVGEGLLEHCRAVQDWIDDIRRRHPGVIIENCGSGAMRADYAMLGRLDLQSTSDQADPLVYAAIAAGAAMTILPEQQGNWGYAQEEMDDEQAVFTLTAGILGRLYLSGFINRMNPSRLALVKDAVTLHRAVLDEQGHVMPWWPDDLPSFNGPWLAYGLRHDERISEALFPDVAHIIGEQGHREFLAVWRRGGVNSMYLHLGEGAHITQVFPDPAHPDHAPHAQPWSIEHVDPETVRFTVANDDVPSSRIFAVTYDAGDEAGTHADEPKTTEA
ncbi:glycoside hydrolase family 36 protein [Bifidobacterium criceti]|uniref:Alpha-galactosidase n=1 Tax=Bifidobacterium criceti TaxID=1960969 RepID=A0A2A2EHY7_9BIFI|nr:glycoside hydrolase family 36 protein [Bifidobacterium criceti]PAU68789.1 alpha-galactosidase [Bifidobacterium criceti]